MKVGDLVKFHTNAWVFEHASARYANPGVVLAIEHSGKDKFSADIYWRNGKITREHESYLQLVKEN